MKWFTAIGLVLISVLHVTAQDSTNVVPDVAVVQISGMVVTAIPLPFHLWATLPRRLKYQRTWNYLV